MPSPLLLHGAEGTRNLNEVLLALNTNSWLGSLAALLWHLLPASIIPHLPWARGAKHPALCTVLWVTAPACKAQPSSKVQTASLKPVAPHPPSLSLRTFIAAVLHWPSWGQNCSISRDWLKNKSLNTKLSCFTPKPEKPTRLED